MTRRGGRVSQAWTRLVLTLAALSVLSCARSASIDPAGLLRNARSDENFRQWLVGVRRELHRKPELMYKEHETSKVIQRELEKLGIPFVAGIGGTGVVATLGNGDGPVVGLRADMDALPIDEDSGVAFRSEHDGRMHACGHDVVDSDGQCRSSAYFGQTISRGKGQVVAINGSRARPGTPVGVVSSSCV